MKNYKIVLLSGDGIGPEISQVAKNIIIKLSKKLNFNIDIKEELFGGIAYERMGEPAPQKTIEECKSSDAILLACVGDYKYDTLSREYKPETGLLKLRSELNLFANIRPIKIRNSLINASSLKKEVITNVDLVVVRELTGGIYFGEPRGIIKINDQKRGFNTMTYSTSEIQRITNIAVKIAKQRNNRICSVDKANVLEVSQLWRDTVGEIANINKEIIFSNMYVDNAAMQLIREPSQFDVILTNNLFGDILSDLAAMLTGSIGMLPSASLSENGPGLFEPIHGSAPDIAGKDIANPIAMLLSTAMLFKNGLNEVLASDLIESAIDKVLLEGYRTIDLKDEDSKIISCSEMGEKILNEI
tara:strand:- start:3521 stop:4594 length:1074 start_codon:yes stop_codon:yes gene_type:complete